MDIAKQIASELSIRTGQAEAVINLIDEGTTIYSKIQERGAWFSG